MTDADKNAGAKQKTRKGLEIPVPKRRDVMDAFRKIARPAKPKR